jgi:hypothetical protein
MQNTQDGSESVPQQARLAEYFAKLLASSESAHLEEGCQEGVQDTPLRQGILLVKLAGKVDYDGHEKNTDEYQSSWCWILCLVPNDYARRRVKDVS